MKFRLLAFALSLTACADRVAAPVTTAPRAELPIATLSSQQSDGIVTLTARVNGSLGQRAGAYAARIVFDPTVVTYVGEGDATAGLVAFNATDSLLKIAGASLDGYAGGVLFNARFRVARPTTDAELRLVIDELRDMTAADRLPAQPLARTALLRPWK
jgi:hypothetical protein